MTLKRIFVWTCDEPGCEAVVNQSGHGLPEGWVFVNTGVQGCIHHCPLHATEDERTAMVKFLERITGSKKLKRP